MFDVVSLNIELVSLFSLKLFPHLMSCKSMLFRSKNYVLLHLIFQPQLRILAI
eukprot:UN04589